MTFRVTGYVAASIQRVACLRLRRTIERECRACSRKGATVASATFGNVTVADYAKFIALHTRHHWKQMQ